MKRISFGTPDELLAHCQNEAIDLIVEYTDEEKKQRQARLSSAELQLPTLIQLFSNQNVMAYYRKDGIFYEINAKW